MDVQRIKKLLRNKKIAKINNSKEVLKNRAKDLYHKLE